MPPRSAKASNANGAAEGEGKVPSSRRSTRMAGGNAPQVDSDAKDVSGTKKRPASSAADKDKSTTTASKKAKPASASAPASKTTTTTTTNGKSTTATASKGEKAVKSSETIEEEAEEAGKAGEAEKEKEKEAEDDKEEAANEEKQEEAPAKAKSTGKTLKQGDKLPKMMLKDEEGKEVDVSGLAGEKGVVIFLYPKADTPGCTNQACGFRNAFDEIAEFGYEIYGLSKDTPTAQKKWKAKKELNYRLLSDPDSQLIKRLGAFVMPKNTKRSHFIFEKGSGQLVEADLGVKPATDPANVLKFLKKHHSS